MNSRSSILLMPGSCSRTCEIRRKLWKKCGGPFDQEAFWSWQDSDFRGCFCHPECAAFSRYVQLYTQTAQGRAVDPNIGPRLPGLLAKAGFEKIQINVVQNAAMSGEVKLMAPLTMENIVDAVLAAGLASRAELDRLVHELYEFARDPDTVIGGPRVVEA